MKSEKVEEIKTALKCCSTPLWTKCDNCSRADEDSLCMYRLNADALTLINELESENERLNSRHTNLRIKYNKIWKQYREYEVENEELAKQCVEWSELDFKKRNKITELKDRIAELEKEKGELKQHITEVEKGIINIARERNKKEELASKFIDSYNDSLKQFAERLKEKIQNCSGCYIPDCFESPTNEFAYSEIEVNKAIDETLKEFLNK